jgi:hypothetical protein
MPLSLFCVPDKQEHYAEEKLAPGYQVRES